VQLDLELQGVAHLALFIPGWSGSISPCFGYFWYFDAFQISFPFFFLASLELVWFNLFSSNYWMHLCLTPLFASFFGILVFTKYKYKLQDFLLPLYSRLLQSLWVTEPALTHKGCRRNIPLMVSLYPF